MKNHTKQMLLFITLVLLTTGTLLAGDSNITIVPLENPVKVDQPVTFKSNGQIDQPGDIHWDFGDGTTATGLTANHTFAKPGIFYVALSTNEGGVLTEQSAAIVRVHTSETLGRPQVILDTDARCEADDQHYISYGLYSNVDILGVNSVHNGGTNTEKINYGEIYYIYKLAQWSGFPKSRIPKTFCGAGKKLTPPQTGNWVDTEPIITEAANAILAAARGASPDNPVWVLPVGPGTNVASAILLAQKDGLDLSSRLRIVWLGGGDEKASAEYNGGNDPYSVYVMAQSGLDMHVLLGSTSLKLHLNKHVDANLYPQNELGRYLYEITPIYQWMGTIPKSLHDVCVFAMVIGEHSNSNWLLNVKPAALAGPENDYKWIEADENSSVKLIWDIDGEAMKKDFFDTINGQPKSLK